MSVPITGYVWNDIDQDGQLNGDHGEDDVPLVGVTVTLQNANLDFTVYGPFLSTAITDSTGYYSLDTAPINQGDYIGVQVQMDEEWLYGGPDTFHWVAGDIADFAMQHACIYTPTSSWVYKICYIHGAPTPNGPISGVKVTFKDMPGAKLVKQIVRQAKRSHGPRHHPGGLALHGGKGLFTVIYPGTSYADYLAMVAAASKGRWVHQFFYKRMYIPWPTKP